MVAFFLTLIYVAYLVLSSTPLILALHQGIIALYWASLIILIWASCYSLKLYLRGKKFKWVNLLALVVVFLGCTLILKGYDTTSFLCMDERVALGLFMVITGSIKNPFEI